MKRGQNTVIIWQRVHTKQSSRYGQTLCWTSWLNWTKTIQCNQRKIRMDNQLKANNMRKEMDWDKFIPTQEIRDYDRRFRESIRQREQLKQDLAILEKRRRDIFWDVEYAMLTTGIKYFNTCSEYWLYKVESEYIKAEKEFMRKQADI